MHHGCCTNVQIEKEKAETDLEKSTQNEGKRWIKKATFYGVLLLLQYITSHTYLSVSKRILLWSLFMFSVFTLMLLKLTCSTSKPTIILFLYPYLFFILMGILYQRPWFTAFAILILHYSNGVGVGVAGSERVPALFVFGDSLVDVGNNNFLSSIAKSNYFPYGIDFNMQPTGRFSNGKTFVDIIGMFLYTLFLLFFNSINMWFPFSFMNLINLCKNKCLQ